MFLYVFIVQLIWLIPVRPVSEVFLRRLRTSSPPPRGLWCVTRDVGTRQQVLGRCLYQKGEETLLSENPLVLQKHHLTAERFSEQGWPPAGSQKAPSPAIINPPCCELQRALCRCLKIEGVWKGFVGFTRWQQLSDQSYTGLLVHLPGENGRNSVSFALCGRLRENQY